MGGTRTGDGGFILVKDSESKIRAKLSESLITGKGFKNLRFRAKLFALSSRTTHDNCPEVENYWGLKYKEKN